jgi:HD-GYP domain-containing protein (c-di-GMP phosphodiesterase class II)
MAPAPKSKQLSPKLQALGRQLVMQLGTVIRTSRIHDASNQALLIASEKLKDTINTLWAALNTVRLQFVEEMVYLNDVRLRIDPGTMKHVRSLREDLAVHGLGGLDFQRPVDSAALRDFLILLAKQPESEQDYDRLKQALSDMKDLALDLLGEKTFADGSAPGEIRIDKKTFALQTYAKAVVASRQAHELIARGEDPLSSRLSATRIAQDLIDIATDRVNFLLKLGAIRAVDEYAHNHAANTCVLSLVIGKSLNIDRLQLVDLGTSALFADAGFALVPREQLDRAEEFSEEERVEIRRAMSRGIRALVGPGRVNTSVMRRVIVAYEHHMPYLDPETGEPAPSHLFSRIVAVADAYDALTTKRPWREGFPPDEALRILHKEAGTRFDPAIVKILTNLVGLYPLGSGVRLDTGEVAVVYHNSNEPALFEKPWVRVVVDAAGAPVGRTLIRNLAEHEGPGGKIVGTVRPSEIGAVDPGMLLVI